MAYLPLVRLKESIDALEKAISATEISYRRLSNKDGLKRTACYREVIARQRLLLRDAEYNAELGRWKEVKDGIELIRHASFMIQFDIKTSPLKDKDKQAA